MTKHVVRGEVGRDGMGNVEYLTYCEEVLHTHFDHVAEMERSGELLWKNRLEKSDCTECLNNIVEHFDRLASALYVIAKRAHERMKELGDES